MHYDTQIRSNAEYSRNGTKVSLWLHLNFKKINTIRKQFMLQNVAEQSNLSSVELQMGNIDLYIWDK